MSRRVGAPGRGDPAGPILDVVKGGEEEDGPGLALSSTLKSPLPHRGISILEKLVKTCPVWLQLRLSREEAARILQREAARTFLVRKDSGSKHLVLCVHFHFLNDSSSEVLEYTIREEKSILYVEGSVLVFEDIFRLIAFYCVSRDLLPFTLRLPQAILDTRSLSDLETISKLGLGFWDFSQNPRRGARSSEPPGDSAPGAPTLSSPGPTAHPAGCSCEIKLSVGNDRLWFVNPIFIEDCVLPADGCPGPATSDATSPTSGWGPRRPPPPPPVPALPPCGPAQPLELPTPTCPLPGSPTASAPHAPGPLGPLKEEGGPAPAPPLPVKKSLPLAPPRRRVTGRLSLEEQSASPAAPRSHLGLSRATSLRLPPQGASDSPKDRPQRTPEQGQDAEAKARDLSSMPEPSRKTKQPPVPPPRKKRGSGQMAPALLATLESPKAPTEEESSEKATPGANREDASLASQPGMPHLHVPASACPQGAPELTGSMASLSDGPGVPTLATEQDSYSTSSTEEELDFGSPSVRKKPSMILDKARHRLSFVSFASVFRAFLSNDRKLYKKVVELAQDRSSYFGCLVQDYKVYSLEMMSRQVSSTEMLQEIRTMMTQLKSYLLQSTELKALVDPSLHSDEGLEAIVESALYKCVLKPLQAAIHASLHELHSRDGSLQQLKENQLVVLATTTTDLGVTTSVPDVPVMEKILQKLGSMHKAYSPEKKIATLLKTCKLIYDSMALGNPGKPYGADDFLPVLMYVLARSNLTEMLLDVEYMMELMDPALQLGEGSYYLTTTYGALEHIKNYDKITVTRQLSVEVQDSINRWERRRTLHKARASRSSVQDFICVSYLEPEQQSRTLASRADTAAQVLCAQCAEKFQVLQPEDYRLFVLVDGRCFQLADEALPHHIKGYLLHSEPKRDFHFVYRPLDGGGGSANPPCLVVREPNFL
ncbi:ras and Rab interactor 3 [Perognathus longimembris pacificus]|uniref:ras and Rab interactor 3 n=1 Tax=Perognathus longimembris pacificus TaxID=214514 RepID=UPI002018B643|nr:ras and Rab interactor 3 [Perognathus longimembris pacificus]